MFWLCLACFLYDIRCIDLNIIYKLQLYLDSLTVWLAQEKLRAASRAKLMRWCKPKSKRVSEVAPDHVRKEWETGNKNALADLYVRENFDKDWQCLFFHTWHDSWPAPSWQEKFAEKLELVISSRMKIKVTLDEGWYSEQELKEDIGWKEYGTWNRLAVSTALHPNPKPLFFTPAPSYSKPLPG